MINNIREYIARITDDIIKAVIFKSVISISKALEIYGTNIINAVLKAKKIW